jgi:hypothetical protein
MPKWPGLVGGTDVAATLIGSGADTVNWYPERLPAGGANQAALLPTPGRNPFAVAVDPGVGGTRALHMVWPNRLFTVIGPTLWEYGVGSGSSTLQARGTVGDDGFPAQLVDNGRLGAQLGIVSAGGVYCFDLTGNTLTGPLLTGGYTHLAYATNVGLALNYQTGVVRLSALNDLGTWDAGQFFQRSLFSDPWRCLFVDQNNLVWLVGADSFEVWYNTGQGTQPFAPLSGLVGAVGIVGPWAFAVAQVGNVWLGRNGHGEGLVMETHGGAPTVLSSAAAATAAARASAANPRGATEVELVTHQWEGHVFTAVTDPAGGAGATWVYDHTEQGWARRGTWNPATSTYGIWAPRVHAAVYGVHVTGDRTTGQLAYLSADVSTELDGTPIRRLRRAPALVSEKKRAPIDQLEILMDVGLGVQTGQGASPTLLLRVSDDGGRTWSNQLRASTGAAGAWRQRVYWTRLGLFNDAVLELTSSDPVPCRLVDAYVNNLESA